MSSEELCGCAASCESMLQVPSLKNCFKYNFTYYENGTNIDTDIIFDWIAVLPIDSNFPLWLYSPIPMNCSLSDYTNGNIHDPLVQYDPTTCKVVGTNSSHSYLSLKQLFAPNTTTVLTLTETHYTNSIVDDCCIPSDFICLAPICNYNASCIYEPELGSNIRILLEEPREDWTLLIIFLTYMLFAFFQIPKIKEVLMYVHLLK